jgi:hypothetical protein
VGRGRAGDELGVAAPLEVLERCCCPVPASPCRCVMPPCRQSMAIEILGSMKYITAYGTSSEEEVADILDVRSPHRACNVTTHECHRG